ncbi:MAG: hypothetical protein GX799_11540 [Crenarchaeota archaeon]|nr:hypothetical protein [Thermoproteota archaeon]
MKLDSIEKRLDLAYEMRIDELEPITPPPNWSTRSRKVNDSAGTRGEKSQAAQQAIR